MTPAKIQYLLKVNGVTQKDIAKKLGVHQMTVSTVINRHRVSDRIMREVAECIGHDVRKVFPEYYLQPPKRRHSKAGVV